MDEPTTALDVVVQREILQQVQDLKRDLGFAVLFITHDLSLLVEFADRIAIMYAGEIVETAPSAALHTNPQHPYTRGLMESFPPLTGPLQRLVGIPGSPPDLADPPAGCRFHPRCPLCVPDGPLVSQADDGAAAAAPRRAGALRRLPSRREERRERASLSRSRNLTKRFPASTGLVARRSQRARRRRRQLHAAPRRDHRARRRERQRQEHGRAAARAAVRPDVGHDPLRRPRRREGPQPALDPALPVAGADDLPGSVRVAQSGEDDPPSHRAAAAHPRDRREQRDRGARARPAAHRRSRAARAHRDEVSAPALGRPAAACRDRAHARRRAGRRCSPTSRRACSTSRSGSGS